MNIFQEAVRRKLRFESPKGLLSVEDLWDLPLTTSSSNRPSLDGIAVALNTALKETERVSFVEQDRLSEQRVEMQLRFDIVKSILDTKVAENKAEREKQEKAATKKRLLEILARKKDAELEGKTPEELEAMVAAL